MYFVGERERERERQQEVWWCVVCVVCNNNRSRNRKFVV